MSNKEFAQKFQVVYWECVSREHVIDFNNLLKEFGFYNSWMDCFPESSYETEIIQEILKRPNGQQKLEALMFRMI